jgi:hypothetical protein
MVGANPNIRTELIIETTVESIPQTNTGSQQTPECAQYNLTPEECINYGHHTYSVEFIDGDQGGCQAQNFTGSSEQFFFFTSDSFTMVGTDFTLKKAGINVYKGEQHSSEWGDYYETYTFYSWGFDRFFERDWIQESYSGHYTCHIKYTLYNP